MAVTRKFGQCELAFGGYWVDREAERVADV